MLHNSPRKWFCRPILATLLILAVTAFVLPVRAAEKAKEPVVAKMIKKIKDGPYPLTTCVVLGSKLGGKMGKPFIYHHKGREVRFCCKGCLPAFKKDPTKYLKYTRVYLFRLWAIY